MRAVWTSGLVLGFFGRTFPWEGGRREGGRSNIDLHAFAHGTWAGEVLALQVGLHISSYDCHAMDNRSSGQFAYSC